MAYIDILGEFFMDEVSLQEMLTARERRFMLQTQLLQQYKKSLISFTLNIPGPIKILSGVPKAFEEGCQRIETSLNSHRFFIQHTEIIKEKTGYEAFYNVDADPDFIKELMVSLEDQDRTGRLFDIDVLRSDGTKVSREDMGAAPRTCLLCSEPAHVCSRSRRHSVAELTSEIEKILAKG